MKFTTAALCVAVSCSTATAFTVVPHHHRLHRTVVDIVQRHAANSNLHEFDYLLQEGGNDNNLVQAGTVSRRRIALTDSQDTRATILASTFPGAPTMIQEEEEAVEDDPYANALDSQLGKINQYQEQKETNTLEAKFKTMDFQDIVLSLVLPGILVFVASRWVFTRVSGKVSTNADDLLNSFARELIYHDGDFKEMELCIKDFQSKMVWMGPAKTDAMLKRYLESYAKKKVVSPQAIASLSYVFTIFKLSEEKAANLLVTLCKEMGTDKISSAGKLLFLGTRILKSPEGTKALQPIKTLIMSTYRDERVAETLVETSQQAIAEAAYRTAVLGAGKSQTKLSPGWEVLGLEKEVATRIFNEEKKIGFLSDREAMYGGQTRKYDKKGLQLDENGKSPNSEADDEDEEVETATSNVYECGQCGFTLFIATGRENKFYGEGFRCPECGASKKEFKARDDMDE